MFSKSNLEIQILNLLKLVDIFHILVLQEYWVLGEGGVPLKPVLGGMIIVALSISSHEQTQ